MSNFTKGEWYVNNTGPHWNNPEIDNHEICYSEAGECVVDHVYNLADANLIAAAPDLYKALENLLETCHASPTGEQERRAAIKALAKARGE